MEYMNEKIQKFEKMNKVLFVSKCSVSVILIAIIIAFSALLWQRVTSFDSDVLMEQFRIKAAELRPAVLNETRELVKRLTPYIQKQISLKVKKFKPMYAMKISGEFDVLNQNYTGYSMKKLDKELNKTMDQQIIKFAKAFPELTDKKFMRRITRITADGFQEKVSDILDKDIQRYVDEIAVSGKIIDDFDLQDIKGNKDELLRRMEKILSELFIDAINRGDK